MAKFILVHGMFHGGWCFDILKPLLEAKGHTVVAEDLPGCGADQTPAGEVSLDLWASGVAALAARGEKVVLLGHSRGGLVVAQAAERVPEHVSAIVYLTALMLPNGKSPMNLPEIMAEQGFESSGEMMVPRFTEDGLSMLPPENAAELFYGACSQEIRDWAVPRVGKEPLAPLMTPITVTPERWGRIPKIYIETTEDKTLPINSQRAMIAAVKPDEVITMHTDHMPIVTDAPALADILDDIAKRYAG
jgi:pimeloyl-ACP methyl ester carboxylesterase